MPATYSLAKHNVEEQAGLVARSKCERSLVLQTLLTLRQFQIFRFNSGTCFNIIIYFRLTHCGRSAVGS